MLSILYAWSSIVTSFCKLALTLVFDFVNDVLESDQRWMREALRLAEIAGDHNEVPVGAVLVKNGEIVGKGWNQPITATDPCAHAEIVALRDAARNIGNYRLVDCTLYVTIEPCAMCAGAMIHARISRLVFGAPELKAGAVVSNNQLLSDGHINHRINMTGGVLTEECGDVMSAFFQRRRMEKRQQKELARKASGGVKGDDEV